MATPSAPHNSGGGMVVVTHVHPQQGAHGGGLPQAGAVPQLASSRLYKFLQGEPSILGAIQIMIGIVILLFGIVCAFNPLLSSYIGGNFWGGAIYITAGSLTVRAYKKLSSCMVKASLGMNIVSAITAGYAIIAYSLTFIDPTHFFYCSLGVVDCGYRQRLLLGMVGVMLVLTVLQFIISICVSAFGCKATCTGETQAVMYITNQIPASLLTAPPSTNQIPASLLAAPPSTNQIPSSSLLTAPPSTGPLNTSELALLPPSVLAPAYHDNAESAPTGQFEELLLLK